MILLDKEKNRVYSCEDLEEKASDLSQLRFPQNELDIFPSSWLQARQLQSVSWAFTHLRHCLSKTLVDLQTDDSGYATSLWLFRRALFFFSFFFS